MTQTTETNLPWYSVGARVWGAIKQGRFRAAHIRRDDDPTQTPWGTKRLFTLTLDLSE